GDQSLLLMRVRLRRAADNHLPINAPLRAQSANTASLSSRNPHFEDLEMFSEPWKMLKETVLSFIDDEALSRGAAIAFYTVTSIAPVLLIVVAIAGLAFGHDAAQNAIITQLSGLMGQQTAEVIQAAIASAAGKSSGILANIIGVATLVATASGVFGEMQSSFNPIWKAKSVATPVF